MLLDSFKSQDDVLPLIRDKDRDWEDCMRRLESFRRFLKSSGYEHLLQDPERLLFGIRTEINGVAIGVGGLNSRMVLLPRGMKKASCGWPPTGRFKPYPAN